MTDIKWETPSPRQGHNATKYDAFRQALIDHPGAWAVLTETAKANTLAAAINRGAGKWSLAPFEATARRNQDGTYTIYARVQADAEVSA